MPEDNTNDENINNSQDSVGLPHTAGDIVHPDATSDNNPVTSSTPVTQSTVDNSVTEPAQPGESLAIPPKPVKKKSKKGLVATIIALLVILLGAGWWFFISKESKTDSQTNATKTVQDIDVLTIGSTEGPASAYFPNEELLGIYSALNRQIYEGLVGFEDNIIAPLIAESWTNPDEKTWVFKIRPGVKFHTGKDLTAKEVKASLDDLQQFDYWSIFVSTIESIEATGDLEVTIKTTEPDALLLNRLSQAYIRDTSAPDASGRNGTGAYQVDASATNDEKSTTMIAFDEYYGGKPKTRKLIYKIFETDDESVKALKDKTIDILETLTFPAINKELTDAGFASVEFETPGVFGIYLNIARKDKEILQNKNVRQSISEAIDRQKLVDGLGNKNTPTGQVIPKSLPGHDTSIKLPIFNAETAKATLDKSGYKNESLDFIYIKELQIDPPILIEQLKAAGFNINTKEFDEVGDALDVIDSGKWDLFSAGYTSDVQDARDVLGALIHSTESSYGPLNDPAYDKLLTDSDKEFDPVKRTLLLQQANKYIADNYLYIPTRNSVYNAYFGKDIDVRIDYVSGGSLGAYYRKVGRITE